MWAQEGAIRIGRCTPSPKAPGSSIKMTRMLVPELDYESTWGFCRAGVSASYNFTDYLGVGLDVLYSNQGQKYKGTQSGIPYTAKATLNYLKLPLLLPFQQRSQLRRAV
jgi:hypothetical protein